jgi:TM2 domain-containing membrane protein YozV
MEPMQPPASPAGLTISAKNKDTLLLLSILLGAFGADRFYRGQIGLAVVKLLTAGGCGVWALIDTLMYLLSDLPTDNEGALIVDSKTLALLRSGTKLVEAPAYRPPGQS